MNASPRGQGAPCALAALLASSLCAACQDDGATASANRDDAGAREDDRGNRVTCTPAAARKIDAAGLTPAESYDSIAVRSVHSPVLIRASLHVTPSGEVTVLERREYPTTISGF